jgi:hypothetical protein
MRRILIENARRKARLKRGGGRTRQPLDETALATPQDDEQLLALDQRIEF